MATGRGGQHGGEQGGGLLRARRLGAAPRLTPRVSPSPGVSAAGGRLRELFPRLGSLPGWLREADGRALVRCVGLAVLAPGPAGKTWGSPAPPPCPEKSRVSFAKEGDSETPLASTHVLGAMARAGWEGTGWLHRVGEAMGLFAREPSTCPQPCGNKSEGWRVGTAPCPTPCPLPRGSQPPHPRRGPPTPPLPLPQG